MSDMMMASWHRAKDGSRGVVWWEDDSASIHDVGLLRDGQLESVATLRHRCQVLERALEPFALVGRDLDENEAVATLTASREQWVEAASAFAPAGSSSTHTQPSHDLGSKPDDADGGLALALSLASDDLDELAAYFAPYEDVTETGHPNDAMRCLQAIDRIRELHAKMLKQRKLPQTWANYARRD